MAFFTENMLPIIIAVAIILASVFTGKILLKLVEKLFPDANIFRGKKPMWLSRELKEKYMAKYKKNSEEQKL